MVIIIIIIVKTILTSASSMVNLLHGSLVNRPQTKSFAESLIRLQLGEFIEYSPVLIIAIMSVGLSPKNGGLPHKQTYRITPALHISTALLYDRSLLASSTSGATI